MAPQPHSERRAAGEDVLGTLTGRDGAAVAAALEVELGALGSYVTDFVMGDVFGRTGLSRRDRSLVFIAILTTLNIPAPLETHVRGGLNHGLTRSEIEEIFVQLGGYAGFPRALEGMHAAKRVFAEMDPDDAAGSSEPAEVKEDDQRRTDAREVMDRMTENQPPGGLGVDMGSFTGTAGRFAFGELWSRPQLARRDRSLVVVSTLTTQDKGTELRFHLQAALNHGVSITELEEIMVTVIAAVGFPTAVQGFRALREVEARQ